jgi:hypothetical protein
MFEKGLTKFEKDNSIENIIRQTRESRVFLHDMMNMDRRALNRIDFDKTGVIDLDSSGEDQPMTFSELVPIYHDSSIESKIEDRASNAKLLQVPDAESSDLYKPAMKRSELDKSSRKRSKSVKKKMSTRNAAKYTHDVNVSDNQQASHLEAPRRQGSGLSQQMIHQTRQGADSRMNRGL